MRYPPLIIPVISVSMSPKQVTVRNGFQAVWSRLGKHADISIEVYKMAVIVHLDEFKKQRRLQAGWALWRRHFRDGLTTETRLGDFEPATLIRLAEPGDASTALLNGLIIALLGFDRNHAFEDLKRPDQTVVLDIYLFIADQIRFEIMLRLGWLEEYGGGRHSLFEMVTAFESVKAACLCRPPRLARTHPRFSEYQALFERDKQVFIRRLVPMALELYRNSFVKD